MNKSTILRSFAEKSSWNRSSKAAYYTSGWDPSGREPSSAGVFEEARARELIKFSNDVRVWQEDESPFKVIAQILRDRGAATGKIGFEGQDITGKAVTPYLLAALVRLTEGRSLAANMALAEHNARVGARIAVAYARVKTGGS